MVHPIVFLGFLGLAAASPLPPHNLVPGSLQSNFATNSTRNSTTGLSPLEMAMRANLALHHAPRSPITSIDHTDASAQAVSERALLDEFAIAQADMPQTSDLGKRDDAHPGTYCHEGTLVKVPFSMWPHRRGEQGFQIMSLEAAVRVQKEIRGMSGPGWEPPTLEDFNGDPCVPPTGTFEDEPLD